MAQRRARVWNECDNARVSYREQPPAACLREWIARISASRDETAPVPVRVLPDGGVDLVFAVECASGAFRADVFGAKSRALLVADREPMDKLAVHLAPGACTRLFRVSAAELADRDVPLAELWGRAGDELAARVAELDTWSARVQLLEATLARAADLRPLRLAPLAQRAARRISARGGREPVARVARELGVTRRTLERAFRDHVGVTAKRFARIARLHVACAALRAEQCAAQAAIIAGYSDQSHLGRDFRELAGTTPGRS
jgi:AraC-like DNA-binding protein